MDFNQKALICVLFIGTITLIHIWKRQDLSTGKKIGFTILVSLFGFIGFAIYWLGSARRGSSSAPNEYEEAVREYENLANEYSGQELINRYGDAFVKFMVHPNLTYNQKCKLIELNEAKIAPLFGNPIEKGQFYMLGVSLCFKMLDKMFDGQSMMVRSDASNFQAAVDGKERLRPLSAYLGEIMTYAALIGSKNGKVKFDSGIFDKYKIPNWLDIVE